MSVQEKFIESSKAEPSHGKLSPLQKAALAVKELRARLDAVEGAQHEPVAIVGMACRFPQADGLEAYWRLLVEGRDAIGEVPAARWDLERFFDANPNAPGKINTRYGGFLDGVDRFDAAFFGISPREAECLDPQQRLLLELAWHALEDAGQPPAALRGSRTGVFVGITQMDYGVMQLGGALEDIQAYTGTGNGMCFAAGRLAYVLGLHGPAFSVDTACSSSMVALHQACQALRNRECDAALVAGAQLNLTPQMQIFLSKTQSFSSDGRCRTFDESANGFVLGEGVGVLVLRRLGDAQNQGDSVRAVIRSSGINHDGPASGLTVPSESAQEALLRSVYERGRITPEDIDYIEAHGTATQLGDPIEVGALRAVFGRRAPEKPLLLGSVKTNFGHLNAAAGIAGLIKVVLMLEHERVAPNLHFKQASSRAPWDGFTVRIPTEVLAWPRQQRPRRAGVSSFGLSGTNTHTVIEEAPAALDPNLGKSQDNQIPQRPLHLFCLSARSDKALQELALAYSRAPSMVDATPVADICFSANAGRNHFACRLAVAVADSEELRTRLDAFATGGTPEGMSIAQMPKGGAGRLAMLFDDRVPVPELRALAITQPRVAATLARCEDAYRCAGMGADLFAMGVDHRAAQFACQFALADLWLGWGLRPQAVSGRGIGELNALCVSGSLELEQAFQVLAGGAVATRAPEISVYSALDGSVLPYVSGKNYSFPAVVDSTSVAMRSLVDAGFKTVIAIGGHAAMQIIDSGMHNPAAEGSLWPMLMDTLARLYVRGLSVDWQAFDAGYRRRRVRLPGYSFQRQRFWLDGLQSGGAAAASIVPDDSPIAESLQPQNSKWLATAPQSTGAKARDLSKLLGQQLEVASAAINEVVTQQLGFLRGRYSAGPVSEGPITPKPAGSGVAPARVDDAPPSSLSDLLPRRLGDWHLLRMAADNEAALEAKIATGLDGLIGEGAVRGMLVHRGADDAAQALGRSGAGRDLKRVIFATARPERSVVFMFPGVGDHYLRMAQGLYASEPVFRTRIDECCEYLKPMMGVDLREILYPATDSARAATVPPPAMKKIDMRAMLGRAPASLAPADASLNQTVHSQPLVFIVEYALAQMWLARGVVPRAMIGYSVGEYAAACLSGVIGVEDALRLVTRRAQMIEELPAGAMLAVPLSEKQVLPLLGENLSLAIVSTPSLCVVGGADSAVSELEIRLRNQAIVSRLLPGTHAFHSRMLACIHDPLVDLIREFNLRAPRIPFVSNLTGDWITEAEACDPAYWARHTWQTVRFADGMGKLLNTEGCVFLEVGPGQSLGSFVLQHPAARNLHDKIVLPSLRNRYEQQSDESVFLTAIGKLWMSGFKFQADR